MNKIYIPRIIESNLNKWFSTENRKPLILRGARQVGKSTLVKNFAKQTGQLYFEINLEIYKNELKNIFDTGNIFKIIEKLSLICGSDLSKNTAILFLDEIQIIPSALQSLRYFYEKFDNLAVIAAGSILEFSLSDEKFSMPVGRVEYLYLSQLNFLEYLNAHQEYHLFKLVNEFSLQNKFSINSNEHDKLKSYLRKYFATGGMPEVVANQVAKKNINKIQSNLINSFKDDLQKYPTTNMIKNLLANVYTNIPYIIGNKVIYSKIYKEATSRDIKKCIKLLSETGIINEIKHAGASGIPIKATENADIFKIYFLDIGLLCSCLGADLKEIEKMEDTRLVNEGILAEQFTCQELLYRNGYEEKPYLNYWLREEKINNAEIDFLISYNNEIIPIEVKAKSEGKMRSLHEYCKIRHPKIAIRFDLNSPSEFKINNETTVYSLPLYLAGKVNSIIDTLK